MKIPSLQLLAGLAVFAAGAPSHLAAQAAGVSVVEAAPGLLGATYTGFDFGYTNRGSDVPGTLHRYGFVSSKPIYEELPNTDAAFRYNYTRASAAGDLRQTHEIAIGLQRYMLAGDAKPYIEGQFGWAWARSGAGRQSGAMYSIGVGVELPVMPAVTFTPFVRFRSSPRFHEDNWYFGAKLLRRFDLSWSGSVGFQLDDDSHPEFSVGVQRRF